METKDYFIGIDIAKAQLDMVVRPTGTHSTYPNNKAGIIEMVTQLKALKPKLIVMEATGGFEVPLASALATAQLPLVVANPKPILLRCNHFAQLSPSCHKGIQFSRLCIGQRSYGRLYHFTKLR